MGNCTCENLVDVLLAAQLEQLGLLLRLLGVLQHHRQAQVGNVYHEVVLHRFQQVQLRVRLQVLLLHRRLLYYRRLLLLRLEDVLAVAAASLRLLVLLQLSFDLEGVLDVVGQDHHTRVED